MPNSGEIILVKISGDDKPGVTAAITEILGNYNATILDIGQADIHHTLSLGILFKVNNQTDSGNILKEILFKSSDLNVNVRFTAITPERYNNWAKSSQHNNWPLLPKPFLVRDSTSIQSCVFPVALP